MRVLLRTDATDRRHSPICAQRDPPLLRLYRYIPVPSSRCGGHRHGNAGGLAVATCCTMYACAAVMICGHRMRPRISTACVSAGPRPTWPAVGSTAYSSGTCTATASLLRRYDSIAGLRSISTTSTTITIYDVGCGGCARRGCVKGGRSPPAPAGPRLDED